MLLANNIASTLLMSCEEKKTDENLPRKASKTYFLVWVSASL
jgi:hypothetical protein